MPITSEVTSTDVYYDIEDFDVYTNDILKAASREQIEKFARGLKGTWKPYINSDAAWVFTECQDEVDPKIREDALTSTERNFSYYSPNVDYCLIGRMKALLDGSMYEILQFYSFDFNQKKLFLEALNVSGLEILGLEKNKSFSTISLKEYSDDGVIFDSVSTFVTILSNHIYIQTAQLSPMDGISTIVLDRDTNKFKIYPGRIFSYFIFEIRALDNITQLYIHSKELNGEEDGMVFTKVK